VGKHTDALKPFDEFRAPWETADGSEAEIDKSKLKRFIYNLFSDKAKAQDSREDALESVKTLEADLEEAKKEAASANGEEATKKIAKLEKELGEAKAKVESLETEKEHNALRAEVLGDLDPKYAKYVVGADREALEKSLEEVKADFGIEDKSGVDDDDDDDEPKVRTRPRANLKNGGDTKPGNDDGGEIDYDKIADGILGTSIF
jgi:chromosome segregation ATPase